MAIEFNPIVWRDGEAPDISADNLNRYETVIPQLVEEANALEGLGALSGLSDYVYANKVKMWNMGSEFPYNSLSTYGIILGVDKGPQNGDSYFLGVDSTPKIWFGRRINQETEITWRGGSREVRLDLGDITIPANGYYLINNREGYPELAAGEKMITTVGNWGSTSPVGAFSVNNKYVFGEPKTTITNLYVLFHIFS